MHWRRRHWRFSVYGHGAERTKPRAEAVSAGKRDDDDWIRLNRTMTNKSLGAASLRELRRYLKAARAQGRVGPALLDNIQELISLRESARQTRWRVIGAVAALVAAVASVLGVVVMWK